MSLPLTEKQELLWRFIKSCERSPTYDEMSAAVGMKSKGGLNRIVLTLKEKGYVSYIPCRARSIVALDPQTELTRAKTSDLFAELERRGMLLGVTV